MALFTKVRLSKEEVSEHIFDEDVKIPHMPHINHELKEEHEKMFKPLKDLPKMLRR